MTLLTLTLLLSSQANVPLPLHSLSTPHHTQSLSHKHIHKKTYTRTNRHSHVYTHMFILYVPVCTSLDMLSHTVVHTQTWQYPHIHGATHTQRQTHTHAHTSWGFQAQVYSRRKPSHHGLIHTDTGHTGIRKTIWLNSATLLTDNILTPPFASQASQVFSCLIYWAYYCHTSSLGTRHAD